MGSIGSYTEFAAHVGHGVTHSSSIGTLVVGAGAAVAVIAFGTACSTGIGTVGCVLAATTAGGLGMDIGGMYDSMAAPAIEERLLTGIDSVFLGPGIKNAARAHEDTITDGDRQKVAEGSELVFLGKEIRPMSRRMDRVLCGGTIAEGIETIIVGGNPSMQGMEITEQDPTAVKVMSLIFSAGSVGATFKGGLIRSGLAGTIGTAVDLGFPEAGALAKLPGIVPPKTILDALGTSSTVAKGIDAGAELLF